MRVRFLDGGLGTSLEDRYGVCFSSETTPLWSGHMAAHPDLADTLRRCQADFCRTGIDVLETATYQLSPTGLARTRLPDCPDGIVAATDITRFLESAVATAEAAAATAAAPPALALSLGPYGATMTPSTEYSGRYDEPGRGMVALRRWHARRLRLFDDVPRLPQRVRLLAFETLPRLDEIAAIRRLYDNAADTADAADAADGIPPTLKPLPFWISCVFPGDDTAAPLALPDGSTPEQAVAAMLDPATSPRVPWGIGINCTKISRLPALIQRYEAAVQALVDAGKVDWPALVLYPDGTNGEVYNTATQHWEKPPGTSARKLSESVRLAATGKWKEILVGGCCKATDRDIKALVDILRPAQ